MIRKRQSQSRVGKRSESVLNARKSKRRFFLSIFFCFLYLFINSYQKKSPLCANMFNPTYSRLRGGSVDIENAAKHLAVHGSR